MGVVNARGREGLRLDEGGEEKAIIRDGDCGVRRRGEGIGASCRIGMLLMYSFPSRATIASSHDNLSTGLPGPAMLC
jgi:hypothetical protein